MDKNQEDIKNNNNSKKDEKKGLLDQILFYLLRNHNWIFVMALMPISICYDIYCFCKYNLLKDDNLLTVDNLLIIVSNYKIYRM